MGYFGTLEFFALIWKIYQLFLMISAYYVLFENLPQSQGHGDKSPVSSSTQYIVLLFFFFLFLCVCWGWGMV